MTHHLRTLRWSAIAVAATLAVPVSGFAQSPAFDSPVVSPEWLSQHLNDPDIVVVNVVSNRREYAGGHIPGALEP